MILSILDAAACIVILLGVIERARCIDNWRGHHIERVSLVLVSAGALGVLLQMLAEAFNPSPFGTLLRVGMAIHYGHCFVCQFKHREHA